jgi:hypothetical protein
MPIAKRGKKVKKVQGKKRFIGGILQTKKELFAWVT